MKEWNTKDSVTSQAFARPSFWRILVAMIEADGDKTFECPKCHALYRGFYRISTITDKGSFDCRECKTEVCVWNGVRDYFKWERL